MIFKEINVLGVHNTVASWIKSQSNPKNPVGTIINVNSGMAGLTIPGQSSYSISKIASHKYMEYVAAGKSASLFPMLGYEAPG